MTAVLSVPIDRDQLMDDLDQLSRIGRTIEGGVSRPAFSVQDKKARAKVKKWMVKAGLDVREDPAGNITGTRNGVGTNLPAIMTGSHLDTVPNGGRFDGALGVLGALETIRALNRAGIKTLRSIRMIVFAAEEPNSFGFSAFGSRVLAGRFPPSWLERTYRNVSFSRVLSRTGGDSEALSAARISPTEIAAFVELHIEQGPVLESRCIPIGIVSVLAGICRLRVQVSGRADHAGTVPMGRRKDALAAASEVVLALEAICRSRSEEVVGTAGAIVVEPNQVNVVPRRVQLEVDLRGYDQEVLNAVRKELEGACTKIETERSVEIDLQSVSEEPPIPLPQDLSGIVAETCRSMNIPYLLMPSGAGHDANHMAKITKTAVIFVPSRNGLSHCPEEWTDEENLGLGVRVLAETIIKLANKDG